MKVNLVNSTMSKSHSVGFAASADGRSKIADQFPLGVQVEEIRHEEANAVRITFPPNESLSGSEANKLLNEQVLPFRRFKDGFEQVYGSRVYFRDKIGRLVLKGKDAVLITSTRLREIVQERAQIKLAAVAAEAAEAAKKL